MTLNRRAFLKRTGWLAGGLTVVATTGCSLIPPLPTFSDASDEDSVTWVQLGTDGRVRFYLPRCEMGQGISTGLTQIVAEELDLPPSEIDCHYQSTAAQAACKMTVGSESVEGFRTVTARAAARLREILRARAAAEIGGTPAQWTVRDGGFDASNGQRVAFADLLKPGEATVLAALGQNDLVLRSERPASELSYVGKTVPGVHHERIVRGEALFSRDVLVPGMRFGRVAKPPQLGTTLAGFDRMAAEAVAGVEAVVERDGEVGVVARTPGAAKRGVAALNTRWNPLSAAATAEADATVDIDQALAEGMLDHTPIDQGDIERGRAVAVQSVSLRYDSPMAAHAAMEPRSAVAWVKRNAHGQRECEVWTGSQDPWLVQDMTRRVAGVKRDRTTVHNQRVGGAFGGRVLCQASVEAAWLSAAVEQPVKVQWTREDEFRHNYVGPPYSTRIDAGLDGSGRITYWHHRTVGAPILLSSSFFPKGLLWVADQIPDPGTERGLAVPYTFAHHKTDFADQRLPMPTGPWRGLGAAPNTFAAERAMDELARAAGIDPIQFRLRHLDNPRLAHCLRTLESELEADAVPEGEAIGIAAGIYKGVTYLAIAARVKVINGVPRVTAMRCVHDCGQVVSPDQVRAQIEGNLVWGIGMALSERFSVADAIGRTDNFDTYALPRQSDVPDMHITLVDSSESSSGAAEAALAPAAAAIANAVQSATGEPVRSLPLTA